MRFPRFRRHADLDARVASARARAAAAAAEERKSRARQEAVREHVVKPLAELQERNHFAALIRDSLLEGRRRP